ncbi:hypothetical protein AVEN_140886-1 [Araneus ventricosus]|uniref:Uncharacterized protein n=1 Tax=Araneus ventricosus TaxID=182803 RepID=A0A4Y2TRB0_ARAVE|nr:hypothetical protein AVEN_140886-1 [Araneus ventricosus]
MVKVRLLPSSVQGLVPTEAALSSFTMNRSPIVFVSVGGWTLGLGLAEDCNEWNKKQQLLILFFTVFLYTSGLNFRKFSSLVSDTKPFTSCCKCFHMEYHCKEKNADNLNLMLWKMESFCCKQ